MILTKQKPKAWHVYPVAAFLFFAIGAIRPLVPIVLVEWCNGNYAQASLLSGASDSVGSVLAFVLIPAVGMFSDRYNKLVIKNLSN